jgi:CRISPR-associated protein Csm1
MERQRELVYLAALLHDIGKFYQRADKSFADKKNEMSEDVLQLANDICPLHKENNFGHQHNLWTAQFLKEIEPILNKIPDFTQNAFDDIQDNIYRLAAYHHKPNSELQALISLADWWSAGIERRKRLEVEEDDNLSIIKWGNRRNKHIPLYSIFNKINNGNHNSAFGLKALSIDEEGFFPSKIEKKEDGISQEKYAALWKQFKEEIEKLPTDSFDIFSEGLIYLLKKYTWCIPSNTTDMENVSLFEHLKTTAAFADCLYLYEQENPDDFVFSNNRLTIKENVKPVILLGGDLSGIQKFIYNIASRKAAVSLKGRSFYLQLLIDSIIQRIISHENIKATLSHVVYSSGGKFYMLLPNTDNVKNAIANLKVEVENELWEKHHGQLIVNIDFVPFAYNNKERKIDFENDKHETVTNQPIGELWKALADKLVVQKNQKFKTLLNNKFSDLFEVQPVNKDAKVCAVTGIESDECVAIDPKEEIKTYVLPIVRKQAELGKTLKDADCILTHLYNEESSYLNTRSKSNIAIFSVSNYLFDEKELKKIDDEDLRQITSADTCRVRWINNTSFLDPDIKGNNLSYGFQFYGGNEQAKNSKNELKTFEELADKSYFGVLRMDVDNLGAIFIKGLPDEDKSFSAYSTLSFMLEYFFSGYLNTIRKRDNFINDVNIIYSGGDDVFAVGKWNKLIEFAEAIRSDFKKFVGRNDISISGGIAIVGDKFPIAKAAEMAGDAESAAKKFGPEKNAFNMFGETISWGKEFEFVKDYKSQFVELCDEKGENMPRSILHRIMTFADMKKRGEISYVWNTAYFLKRFSSGKSDKIKSFCRNLSTELIELPRNYELIALAARWTELELKKRNNV